MARRMFSPLIVDSDAFLDMSPSAQNLYFHLGMRADDDGFVGNPKKILRMVGGNDDDLKILIAKRFILTFESGVIVIKHWRINNLIRKDWYRETVYLEEKKQLEIKENGSYTDKVSHKLLVNETAPESLTQVSIGKDSIGKDSERTPSQEAKDFFQGNYEPLFNEIKSKLSLDTELLKQEFQKFILYWTEKNKSGTKQRWEQQPTFEVKRRLITWLSKMKDFKNKNNEPNYVL